MRTPTRFSASVHLGLRVVDVSALRLQERPSAIPSDSSSAAVGAVDTLLQTNESIPLTASRGYCQAATSD